MPIFSYEMEDVEAACNRCGILHIQRGFRVCEACAEDILESNGVLGK